MNNEDEVSRINSEIFSCTIVLCGNQ